MKAHIVLALAAFTFAGCGSKSDEPSKSSTSGGNPVTAPVDYLGAVVKAKKSAEKTVEGAMLTQAVQMFQAQEGRFPTSLDELVAKQYLNRLPPPPYGMRFDYDPKTGKVSVVAK